MEDKKYNPGDEEDPASFPIDDIFDKRYFVQEGDVFVSKKEEIKYVDKDDPVWDLYDSSKYYGSDEEVYGRVKKGSLNERFKKFVSSFTGCK